jgi:hypothetical protein
VADVPPVLSTVRADLQLFAAAVARIAGAISVTTFVPPES